jgi:hypothetical protein
MLRHQHDLSPRFEKNSQQVTNGRITGQNIEPLMLFNWIFSRSLLVLYITKSGSVQNERKKYLLIKKIAPRKELVPKLHSSVIRPLVTFREN